jgi:hypothetical protein
MEKGMKKIIVLLVVLMFSTVCFSQEYTQEKLSAKLKSAMSMRNTGKGLTGAGIGLNVIGLVVYMVGINKMAESTNDDYYSSYDNNDSDDGVGMVLGGAVLMIAGDVMMAVGIPLWIVGGVRSGRYQRLLNQNKTSLNLNFDQKGIGLQLHF